MKKLIKAFICACVLAGLLTADGFACAEAGSGELSVHVFSFGKADSYLFMTGESAVLIDCGESENGKEIVQYLKEKGFSELDCLILTHFDKDHVGGAAKVLKSIQVQRVLQSNSPKDSKQMEKYLKALDGTGVEAETVSEELTFTLGDAEFTVYPPQRDNYEKDPSNNSSLVTSVRLGENSFLFTGDAESARLAEIVSLELGTFDVLQIPHHGEWDMLLVNLLRMTDPSYALITSSEEEPEDMRTMQLLQQESVEALLAREGEVDIVSDGRTVAVSRAGDKGKSLAPAA